MLIKLSITTGIINQYNQRGAIAYLHSVSAVTARQAAVVADDEATDPDDFILPVLNQMNLKFKNLKQTDCGGGPDGECWADYSFEIPA